MTEKQEKVWVVLRKNVLHLITAPVKVFDDRKDARAYAKRYNGGRDSRIRYSVHGVKKG